MKETDENESDNEVKEAMDKDSEDIWAEDSKVILRKDYQSFKDKRSDNESASGSSSLKQHRRSDQEGGYSSPGDGETSYFSAPSGQSRPTSSDLDIMLSAVSERSTTDNSEFLTAQDHSTLSSVSQYHTAASTRLRHVSTW